MSLSGMANKKPLYSNACSRDTQVAVRRARKPSNRAVSATLGLRRPMASRASRSVLQLSCRHLCDLTGASFWLEQERVSRVGLARRAESALLGGRTYPLSPIRQVSSPSYFSCDSSVPAADTICSHRSDPAGVELNPRCCETIAREVATATSGLPRISGRDSVCPSSEAVLDLTQAPQRRAIGDARLPAELVRRPGVNRCAVEGAALQQPAMTEIEFHISPAASWSRPQEDAGGARTRGVQRQVDPSALCGVCTHHRAGASHLYMSRHGRSKARAASGRVVGVSATPSTAAGPQQAE